MKDGWQLPLATLVMVILFAAFNAKPMATAADIAAWVQGVGSLAAVGSAIWIYWRQLQDKNADQKAEIRAFVQAMRTEVDTFWKIHCRDVQPQLKDFRKSRFDGHAPLYADQLMIYRTTPTAIGKIDDPELRDLAVKVHAIAYAMIGRFMLNASILRDLRPLEPFYHQNGKEFMVVDELYKALSETRKQLKDHDRELSEIVPTFLARANAWLEKPPERNHNKAGGSWKRIARLYRLFNSKHCKRHK
ncbi:MAG: hypothetical protein EPN57_17235 [Paraburkholderia sp.]|nr:MAG: hypothetical protein EPN57_17235 [Paraburkholderia sp.]